jgi:alkylated DNA repair dioxygenase AlkB
LQDAEKMYNGRLKMQKCEAIKDPGVDVPRTPRDHDGWVGGWRRDYWLRQLSPSPGTGSDCHPACFRKMTVVTVTFALPRGICGLIARDAVVRT